MAPPWKTRPVCVALKKTKRSFSLFLFRASRADRSTERTSFGKRDDFIAATERSRLRSAERICLPIRVYTGACVRNAVSRCRVKSISLFLRSTWLCRQSNATQTRGTVVRVLRWSARAWFTLAMQHTTSRSQLFNSGFVVGGYTGMVRGEKIAAQR